MRISLDRLRPRISARARVLLLCLGAATIAGCGSDGSTTPWNGIPNFVRLQSDPGDHVGEGETYEYTKANAVITVAATSAQTADGRAELYLRVDGEQRWTATVTIPDAAALRAGTYPGAIWTGEGRQCGSDPVPVPGTGTGTVTVDSVTYAEAKLAAIDYRVDQQCPGDTGALHATVHWRADDPTLPPGPVTPIPADLWKPDPSLIPATTGSYVVLVSEPGDPMGEGVTRTYTSADQDIRADVELSGLWVSFSGTVGWHGRFKSMVGTPEATVGYYPGLKGFPNENPAKGTLTWNHGGFPCTVTGWYVVDRAAFDGPLLTALDLRFEQRCVGFTPALRGAVHWTR
jgi:hypothetical protein